MTWSDQWFGACVKRQPLGYGVLYILTLTDLAEVGSTVRSAFGEYLENTGRSTCSTCRQEHQLGRRDIDKVLTGTRIIIVMGIRCEPQATRTWMADDLQDRWFSRFSDVSFVAT